ncbi:type IX secretion system sortase PorU [Dysgonomonas macrotermitis]|uniref:Peptidase family C25 n=1 Tax=Dysgonomonas macrotermitis TaxID=1346286 RepID=A0A1M5G0R2_9BACT|nr:type IX secretion system sortase PorU [Dysgonomonas macrotermitis]SHF97051.1 Peptidase family C25 [Dysgonomonas macrotermitis]
MQKKLFVILILLLSISIRIYSVDNDPGRYTANSVLSQGKWYKIKISQTGVYKLTYQDLKKMGLSNPQNVKIYGYGGWVLNEDFQQPYIDDLPPVSIWMSKSQAEFKNNDDYILFYARGDIKWTYNSTTGEFEQTQNPYSSDSYYFVTETEGDANLMATQASLTIGSNLISAYDDYVLHEQELVNVGSTGREFYGENLLSSSSVNITLNTEGATTDPAILRYNFISNVYPTSGKLSVSLNGTKVKEVNTWTNNDYYIFGRTVSEGLSVNTLQSQNTVSLAYTKGSSTDKNVYLNYLRINFKRKLKPYGAVTLFRSTSLSSNLGFNISDASSSVMVFDVTANTAPVRISTQLSGTSLRFASDNSSIREYAMVDLSKVSNIPVPTYSGTGLGAISNQNLHASSSVDMIIIVQDYLKDYAKRLADLHEKNSGLKSLLVNPEDIYNEFSSGKPDASAYRRFMKMFYDRAGGGDGRPQYLLLFGGGSYDNKMIQNWTDDARKSMLLTYQSPESLDETNSYVTDDYFGFMDDAISSMSSAVLSIGIGRLPVRSATTADNIVSKIETYVENQNKGIWQNNLTFVADDAVAGTNEPSSERNHMLDAEEFSSSITAGYPDFVIKKIYEDMYERVVQSNGARYPDANRALLEQINNGTLFINFIGHGATTYWTHENLLTMTDIEGLSNDKLPLWITATCDFSRFDSNTTSGGEEALLKESGGAIGLFSTVRVVYIGENRIMNRSLMKHIFEKKDGKNPRLGDVLRNSKNDSSLSSDGNKLRFVLLGDPALKLAYPEDTYRVEITEMNNRDADATDINIQALDDTSIKGVIVNQSGDITTDFNGTLESIIFDAQQELQTRGNTQSGSQNSNIAVPYVDYTNTLFSGKIQITNGEFEFNFVAPKDILYADDKGKMSFFAYETSGDRKAQGSFYNYTVGGTNTNMPEEENPPVISRIYLNSDQFRPGDIVNSTPLFYAEFSDDTGINLTSTIGHGISLILDGITTYDLTPYFSNEENSNKKGSVTYRLPQMSEGSHTLEFRVWDVWNNSASETLNFTVSDDYSPTIYSFEIWGNPAKEYTRFVVNTNNVETNVDLTLRVYSLTGALVWATQKSGSVDTLNRYIYDWDLNTYRGGRVQPGIYICTAQISINGKQSSLKAAKLIVSDIN